MFRFRQLAIALTLAIVFPVASTHAEESDAKPATQSPPARREKIRSRDLRESAAWDLRLLVPTFGFAGISPYGVFDYGVRLGIYDSPNFQWGLSFRQGSPHFFGEVMKPRSSSKGFTSNVAADGQLFLGNSFFGRGGVELRQYRTTVRERFFVSEKDGKGKYQTSERRGVSSFRDIGLTFGIGNDWIDGPHAFFSVDWISVYISAADRSWRPPFRG